ncbi:hypothetical protein [Oscillibacter sp.]|uniref:hypothetical protein n=1 Tax=Oscillibacter sp. TaxID=1945593 RepID=UPI0028A0735D|nr:hypothetical protein [Oscillibacter sp.]
MSQLHSIKDCKLCLFLSLFQFAQLILPYRIIFGDLFKVTHFTRQKEALFAEYINRKNTLDLRQEMNSLQKELDAAQPRDTELTARTEMILINYYFSNIAHLFKCSL